MRHAGLGFWTGTGVLLGLLCGARVASAGAVFTVSSPSFKDNGSLPAAYTGDGDRVTPPLQWANAPAGAKVFAVTIFAVDEKQSLLVMYNLPAAVTSMEADAKPPGTMGVNGVDHEPHYSAPAAKEAGDKKYRITVYALSEALTFAGEEPVTMEALLSAMKGKTLATAAMTVTYARTAGEIADAAGGGEGEDRLPPQIGRAMDEMQLSPEQGKQVQAAVARYQSAEKRARQQLLVEMKKVLEPEQYKQFEESLTAPPPPPPDNGGGPGGPPPGR